MPWLPFSDTTVCGDDDLHGRVAIWHWLQLKSIKNLFKRTEISSPLPLLAWNLTILIGSLLPFSASFIIGTSGSFTTCGWIGTWTSVGCCCCICGCGTTLAGWTGCRTVCCPTWVNPPETKLVVWMFYKKTKVFQKENQDGARIKIIDLFFGVF